MEQINPNKPVQRKLGSSELLVSAVGLGCMSLSGVYGAAEEFGIRNAHPSRH